MRPLLRTPAEGVDTIVWLATRPGSGVRPAAGCTSIADRGRSTACPATRLSATDRRRLWDLVVELSGEPDPAPGA